MRWDAAQYLPSVRSFCIIRIDNLSGTRDRVMHSVIVALSLVNRNGQCYRFKMGKMAAKRVALPDPGGATSGPAGRATRRL